MHLRFLKKEEAEKVMEEIHQGICGLHMNEKNVIQEDLKDRVLLEHNGNRLSRLCEELPRLLNTCKLESCGT